MPKAPSASPSRSKRTTITKPVKKKTTRAPKTITKANRKPVRSHWPPSADRVQAIVAGLEALYPDVDCELDRETPFQLLIATILSAQTTDERVNQATPALFARFPNAPSLAAAPLPVVEDLVRTTGFYRQKAKNIRATAAALVERHNGELPKTIEALIQLPGVARKTANVVLGTAFNIAAGVVVDTHVQRLAMRMALTRETTPQKIEEDLMKVLPQETWIRFSHQIIWHGRRVCFARKPDCDHCTLAPHCPGAFREAANPAPAG